MRAAIAYMTGVAAEGRAGIMVTEKNVLDALATVAGPDGRTCVSRTNGIAGLTIRDGKVYLALAGDPRLAEAMETMRAEAERQLHEYLAGDRVSFELSTALPEASALRRAVWALIAAIPYGETRTYRSLAGQTGSHPRAVGSAVAHNPLSIVVPCHRVIGSGGSLTGYAGGLERKAKPK